MPEDLQRKGCELCLEANVAGHRADVTLRRAARALAALADRQEVRLEDVLLAAELVLASRARPAPPPPPEQDEPEPDEEHEHEEQQEQDESEEEQPQEEHPEDERPREEQRGQGAEPEEREAEERDEPQENEGEEQAPPRAARETVFDVGEPFRVRDVPLARDRVPRTGPGKRTRSRTPLKAGRYVRSRRDPKPSDLALDATLRAAAPHQRARAGTHPGLALAVETGDLMRKVREKRVGSCIVLAVDASGSMGAARRMVEAKGAVLSLLLDAYQKRDTVAFVAFRGQEAELLLPPTGSVELAYRHLEELPTGGRTPLSDGLSMAYQVLDARLRKDPATFPVLVLVSDGRANVASFGGKPLAEAMEVADAVREDGRIRAVVVDVEKPGLVSFGLAGELAARMGARCYKVEELRADTLVRVLREEILPE
jgi:magnesium chelatase subunit D